MTKVITVRLEDEDINKLLQIAKEENAKKSALIKKAVRKYVNEYGRRQPEVSELFQRIEEMEKKFNNLLTRVNILTKQLDSIVGRQR